MTNTDDADEQPEPPQQSDPQQPEPPQQPDGKPSTRLSAEDAARLEELFREHGKALERFLIGRLNCRQEALDLAQDTYTCMAAYMARPMQGQIENLAAFMFVTAENLLKNTYKKNQRRRASLALIPVEAEDYRTLDLWLYSQQQREALQNAVRELAPKHREALQKYKDPCTYLELAKRLGITSRTVRRHACEALDEIRRKVGPGDSK